MPGYNYMKWVEGTRVQVSGMKVIDDPEKAGFDWHYLYPEDRDDRTGRTKPRINRLPYRQLA